MPWFKVDDKSHSHAKVIDAGNAAWGALVRLGAWASDHATDGEVPARVARAFATPEEVADLVRVGLLEESEHGFYVIHDFLQWNPSAKEVAKVRKERAKAGRKGARQTNGKRAANESAIAGPVADALPAACTESVTAKARPDPIPDPDPGRSKSAAAASRPPRARAKPGKTPREPRASHAVDRASHDEQTAPREPTRSGTPAAEQQHFSNDFSDEEIQAARAAEARAKARFAAASEGPRVDTPSSLGAILGSIGSKP